MLNFITIMRCIQFHSLILRNILLSKYQSFSLITNNHQWIYANDLQFMFLWRKTLIMEKNASTLDFILNKIISLFLKMNTSINSTPVELMFKITYRLFVSKLETYCIYAYVIMCSSSISNISR